MKWITAIVVALLTAGPTFANGASGIPFQKGAHAVHRIETQEPHTDFVFVLYREGLQYDDAKKKFEHYQEAEFINLTPDRPLVLDLIWTNIENPADKQRTQERAAFACVPRGVATPDKTAMDLYRSQHQLHKMEWHWFSAREEVPSWGEDEITITYRVQRKPSGDGLEIVRTSRNPRWQWNAAVGFVSVAIIIGGLWIIRRSRSRAIATAK